MSAPDGSEMYASRAAHLKHGEMPATCYFAMRHLLVVTYVKHNYEGITPDLNCHRFLQTVLTLLRLVVNVFLV
jgi:hypothetical protein